MALLVDTDNISVDIAHHEIVRTKVGIDTDPMQYRIRGIEYQSVKPVESGDAW